MKGTEGNEITKRTERKDYRKRRITRCGAPETYSTPPTAHMAGAIGLIFGLGVHRVNINGATMAIFEFPSRT